MLIAQGRIQDLKKEESQRVSRITPKANLGDFLKNLAQKGVAVSPPSGSAPGALV